MCTSDLDFAATVVMLTNDSQEKAHRPGSVMAYEYKNFSQVKLHEAAKILGHHFLMIAERVGVQLSDWRTNIGGSNKAEALGFGYVRGICHFVRTFENPEDLGLMIDLFNELPILQKVYGPKGPA